MKTYSSNGRPCFQERCHCIRMSDHSSNVQGGDACKATSTQAAKSRACKKMVLFFACVYLVVDTSFTDLAKAGGYQCIMMLAHIV
jgi:hypothetical protein